MHLRRQPSVWLTLNAALSLRRATPHCPHHQLPASHALQDLLSKPLAGKPWTQPQRDWLKRIAAQTKANMLVDRAAVDCGVVVWPLCIQFFDDGHAVQQIGRNIELIRYRRFGDDLLLLESVNAGSDSNGKATAAKLAKASASKLEPAGSAVTAPTDQTGSKGTGPDKSFAEVLASLPEPMQLLLASLEDYTFSLGDDVQRKELRLYAAFKRLKNFATVVLHRKNCLLLYLHVDPATALPVLPNARDVTSIGHWGTGNLEVALSNAADLDSVKPFIAAAYDGRNSGKA